MEEFQITHFDNEGVPEGWDRSLWLQVEKIAERMSREELIKFYKETGAIKAKNLNEWTKAMLTGVLDELDEKTAKELMRVFSRYLK